MSLGRAQDWSLTEQTFAGLESELKDHVACLRDEHGDAASQRALAGTASAKARRRLTGPHIAEQVYVTLHRRPTLEERNELAMLLLWFVLILLGDWLAAQVYSGDAFARNDPGNRFNPLLAQTWAWLLHGIGRAGFFASLAYYLYRAWQRGGGVLIARLIQLKLLHTVLVVMALVLLGQKLDLPFHPALAALDWPAWINARTILLAAGLLALAVLVISRGRHWAVALFAGLLGAFLYCGAPVPVYHGEFSHVLLREKGPDGKLRPSTNRALIEQKAEKLMQGTPWGLRVDVDANVFYNRVEFPAPYPGTYWYWHSAKDGYDLTPVTLRDRTLKGFWNAWISENSLSVRQILDTEPALTPPLAAAKGGLGWLAAPIPLLGLAGLLGLLLVMGRRGFADAAIYSLLVLAALATTILPFTYGSNWNDIFALNAHGMIAGPVPGFEDLLVGHFYEMWLIFLGLVLSAGVPWLLAALFLKPGNGSAPPDLARE